VDYSVFKPLLGLLFFGSAFVFGFWQLASLRRLSRQQDERDQKKVDGWPDDCD
jgi:hypothetical protein